MLSLRKKEKKHICPICDSSMSFLMKGAKVKCGDYFYYKCDICNHVLLAIPKDINLQYQSNYRKNMPMSGDVVEGELSKKYYSNRKNILAGRTKKIKNFIKGKKSIFEIGCGGGYLLNYYKKKNHLVAGIEIDDLCINACKKLGIDCIKGNFLSTKLKRKYNAVMAWHVLEHVIDINKFMKKMVALAKKDGLIFIEIPVERELKKDWVSYDGHVHYFSKKSFKKLMDKFNLYPLYLGEGIQKPALLFIGTVPGIL